MCSGSLIKYERTTNTTIILRIGVNVLTPLRSMKVLQTSCRRAIDMVHVMIHNIG